MLPPLQNFAGAWNESHRGIHRRPRNRRRYGQHRNHPVGRAFTMTGGSYPGPSGEARKGDDETPRSTRYALRREITPGQPELKNSDTRRPTGAGIRLPLFLWEKREAHGREPGPSPGIHRQDHRRRRDHHAHQAQRLPHLQPGTPVTLWSRSRREPAATARVRGSIVGVGHVTAAFRTVEIWALAEPATDRTR